MKTNRRTFLKQIGALSLAFTCDPLNAIANKHVKANTLSRRITILHTNDVHSHIDPIQADNIGNIHIGGFARRKTYIDIVRNEVDNLLVLECGDMFQGTPYFNIYKGKLEIELMNKMGIDAVTIGNHEFDNGLDELYKRIKEANFPFLNANYDFKDHKIASVVKPYKVFEKTNIKVGVFGLGIKLDGLVSQSNYGQTAYYDPIESANKIANELRNMGCDIIIAITHIGYQMTDLPDDISLAQNSEDIDIILGGHTHTLLSQPTEIINRKGKVVLINQVGFGGINIGRIDIELNTENKITSRSTLSTLIC